MDVVTAASRCPSGTLSWNLESSEKGDDVLFESLPLVIG